MTEPYIKTGKEIEVLKNKEVTIPIENVKSELPKYWEKDYINSRINACKNYQHKIMLQFLWLTGCRITEAISILKRDIDFNNYTINLRWLKNRKYNYRVIPLHPSIKDLLQLYTVNMKLDDRVFPISRQRAWVIVQNNLNGHPHQFRHSFAVNWLRSAGEITTLSKMLGHSNINTTMVYLNLVPIDIGKELLKISFV